MKIFIVSDTHIKDSRIFDFSSDLHQVEEYVKKFQPDLYVHAGDIFDKRTPTPISIRLFVEHVFKISTIVKQVHLLIGNHDSIDKELSTLDFFQPLSSLLKCKVWRDYIYLPSFSLYAAHLQIKEAKLNNGLVSISPISWKTIVKEHPNIKYFIFGHIHTPQILNQTPLVLIPGSIDRISFAERGEQKYCYLLDTTTSKLKKLPISNRPMYQVNLNLDKKLIFINGKLASNFSPSLFEGAILKVKVSGTVTTLKSLKLHKLHKLFSNPYSIKIEYDLLETSETPTIKTGLNLDQLFLNYLKSLYKSKKLSTEAVQFCKILYKTIK